MTSLTPSELREEFSDIDNADERLEYIIEFSDGLPPMPVELCTEENRVQGCVSQVWVVAEVKRDDDAPESRTVHFQADSDAVITRGLIAILVALLNGLEAREILAMDIDGLFDELDLQSHLTRSRSNGLRNMVRSVRALAESALEG